MSEMFSKDELGVTKFMKDDHGMKVIEPNIKMKSMKIEENEGQCMVTTKFNHAGKRWKPKGRK